jgi:hypothetical protein
MPLEASDCFGAAVNAYTARLDHGNGCVQTMIVDNFFRLEAV